jgi:hypothetical protein
MIYADDDVGEVELEDDLYDSDDDAGALAGPAAVGLAPGPVDMPGAVGRVRWTRAGDGWVTLLLLAGAGVATFGILSALGDGSAWGVILNGVAAMLCVVGAVVERAVHAVGPVGTRGMRVGHYARLAIVVALLFAVVRFGAQEEGGLDAVAWHVPTALFALAVVVQWWRDPQRMT